MASMACLLAAPPARAGAPYNIFFEPGSARIDGLSGALLDNAAAAFFQVGAVRIEVTGAADRLGSSADNLRLSARRAEAVKAYLVSRGVPAQMISVEGVGERRPMIETADGVSERLNRWANVMLVLNDGRRVP